MQNSVFKYIKDNPVEKEKICFQNCPVYHNIYKPTQWPDVCKGHWVMAPGKSLVSDLCKIEGNNVSNLSVLEAYSMDGLSNILKDQLLGRHYKNEI